MQMSSFPERFWMERHMLPLSPTTPFEPQRGRYCLDDTCAVLADSNDLSATDYMFDYTSAAFALRRPMPCPKGYYCGFGTAVNASNMKNLTTPQPCSESIYCPEASTSAFGAGKCPPGFYCPFGERFLLFEYLQNQHLSEMFLVGK